MLAHTRIAHMTVAALVMVVLLYTLLVGQTKVLDNVAVIPSTELEQPYPGPTMHPDSAHLFTATQGAVACDVDICSKMATDIMAKSGGNAVDAAVTTALCIGTVNSFSSGIGGGGFMTVRLENGTTLAVNFREMAPGNAHKDMFADDPMKAQVGGLAVAIPGEVAGLEAVHTRYGQLSWEEVFRPVIDLNFNGFIASDLLEQELKDAEDQIWANPEEWAPFITGDRRVVQAGELVKRPAHGKTLQVIAEQGAAAFYDPNGPIAPYLVKHAQKHGGVLTEKDLARYQVEITEALKGSFMGRDVYITPNPTSGPALLMALNLLEPFEGTHDLGDLETHQLVEAMKWMSSGRSELGDLSEKHNDSTLEDMVDKGFANELRKKIDDHSHPWQYYEPKYELTEPHGTAHLSVVDRHGMAVALTTTVNLGFGARIIEPHTGVVLNSEMDDFSISNTSNFFGFVPSIYNYIEPYNRPLSSTTPTVIVKDAWPEVVIGGSGGSRIYTSVLQAIIRLLKYNLPLLETVAYPRVHDQLLPDQVELEPAMPVSVYDELARRNHTTCPQDKKAAVNAIHVPMRGTIHAVADYWRKLGAAWGY